MSVTVRPYRRGGWQVDVRLVLPDGNPFCGRKRFTTLSKTTAQRWGQDRERHVLQHGLPQLKKEVPTLKEFGPRFVDEHARANRQKASGIAAKEMILRVHLLPMLGEDRRLDAITNSDVQRLKFALRKKAPKTVNNILTVLNTMLKKAVEWGVLDQLPCAIKLLPTTQRAFDFYDFDEFEALGISIHLDV